LPQQRRGAAVPVQLAAALILPAGAGAFLAGADFGGLGGMGGQGAGIVGWKGGSLGLTQQ